MSFSLFTLLSVINSVAFSFLFFFLNVSSEHQLAGKTGGVGLEGAAGREGGGWALQVWGLCWWRGVEWIAWPAHVMKGFML